MMRKFIIGRYYLKEILWNYLLKQCDYNEIEAAKILYRANKRKPKYLIGFIKSALTEGWILRPDFDEENNPRPIVYAVRRFLGWIAFMGWKK